MLSVSIGSTCPYDPLPSSRTSVYRVPTSQLEKLRKFSGAARGTGDGVGAYDEWPVESPVAKLVSSAGVVVAAPCASALLDGNPSLGVDELRAPS